MARLGDICEILNGYAFKSEKYISSGIRIIRIANVQKGYIEDTAPIFYPIDTPDIEKYTLYEDDLLISLTGNVGRVALLKKEFLPAALNQRVACLRLKNGVPYDKSFLYCFLNSDYFENKCIQTAKGVAQKNMSTEWLKEYEIPDLSLEEQREIATVLNKISELIAARTQQLSTFDDIVKSRFIELFGDPVLNPYNWDVVTIGDIVTDVRYGTSRPATEGGKYPYLRMNNLTFDGHLDLSDLKYIDIPENEIEKCIVRKGDVLFNRTNSIELVGKTCVFDLEEDMVIAGYIIRVRLNEKVLPIVLSSYMNSTVLKEQLRSMAKGAVNQANINAQELQRIKIYLPPLDLQNEFTTFVEQTDKLKFEVKEALEKLETLKESLMQQYFG